MPPDPRDLVAATQRSWIEMAAKPNFLGSGVILDQRLLGLAWPPDQSNLGLTWSLDLRPLGLA
jgi:hypothetical protein